MKIIFDSSIFTDEYVDTILDLVELAGFHIDLVDDDEGDIAILADENATEKQKTLLTNLRKFDII